MAGAFYVLWRQGSVSSPGTHARRGGGDGWGSTLQSGIFLRGATAGADKPKLSFTAFRFPFTAYLRKTGSRADLWGLAPGKGKVIVERRTSSGWKRAATLKAGGGRVFTTRLRARRGETMRARQGDETSMTWRVLR